MFETVFEADNGRKFVFGRNGGNYYGMSIGNGVNVALGTSQGFSQTGETVQTQSVGGRPIDVRGELYGDIAERKNALRMACAPMTAGRLIFGGAYYIRVFVQSAPTFIPKRGDGRFMMQFYAPFPYFSAVEQKAYTIGGVTKEFRFPVNYAKPHRFGTRSGAKATNVVNDGDVEIHFRMEIRVTGACANPTITNMETREFLRLNGEFTIGNVVAVYRDENNAIRAELTADGATTDILSRLDDDSNLFRLVAGDNMLAASDDYGGTGMIAQFTFHTARAAMYEDQII